MNDIIEFFKNEYEVLDLKYKKLLNEKSELAKKISDLDNEKKRLEDLIYKVKTSLSYFGIVK